MIRAAPDTNEPVVGNLKAIASKISGMEKICSNIIDVVIIRKALTQKEEDDIVDGLVDLESVNRVLDIGAKSLSVMIKGVCSQWK